MTKITHFLFAVFALVALTACPVCDSDGAYIDDNVYLSVRFAAVVNTDTVYLNQENIPLDSFQLMLRNRPISVAWNRSSYDLSTFRTQFPTNLQQPYDSTCTLRGHIPDYQSVEVQMPIVQELVRAYEGCNNGYLTRGVAHLEKPANVCCVCYTEAIRQYNSNTNQYDTVFCDADFPQRPYMQYNYGALTVFLHPE